MTDPRVEKLGNHYESAMLADYDDAVRDIRDFEAAGLLVIDPTDEATIERLAVFMHADCTEPTGIPWEALCEYEPHAADEYRDFARKFLAALSLWKLTQGGYR